MIHPSLQHLLRQTFINGGAQELNTSAGGTAPYTITPANWYAGLHTFTVTDANGCLSLPVTITEPARYCNLYSD
jgi:hypothetical protein